MELKSIFKYFIFLGFVILFALSNCEECENCGPSMNEPYLNVRFFNIDSLIEVNKTLICLQDSIGNLNEEITNGNEDLIPVRDSLQNTYNYYLKVSSNIKNGKLKIDEMYGMNGEGPIYFTDSTVNDSLTNFKFPLNMNLDQSAFVVHMADRIDTLGFTYIRRNSMTDYEVSVDVYDISLSGYTYDSARVICSLDSCTSNQTKIYVYF